MKIIFIILSVFIIAAISGCFGPKEMSVPGGKVTVEQAGSGPDWCKAGTKITSSTAAGQGTFEIKGITTHNETEVCEANYASDQGSMTQYFNKDGSYMVMVYKDKNGNVQQEINMANPTKSNT